MNPKGKVYGLVGVIGSGKSYRAEMLCVDAATEGRRLIMGDFSEGIRQTLMNIFTGQNIPVDVNGADYNAWKNMVFEIPLPTPHIPFTKGRHLAHFWVSGRDLLCNAGEHLKKLAGQDVWARWTLNVVMQRFYQLAQDPALDADLVFGSVRFDCEAKAVLQAAQTTGKDVEFIFCNYKSERYALTDHESERYARYFLDKGCQDGDNITELVKKKLDAEV